MTMFLLRIVQFQGLNSGVKSILNNKIGNIIKNAVVRKSHIL